MSTDRTRRYLVAYDIVSDRRRTRVADLLGSFGDRIQFSVFILDIRPARLIRLRQQVIEKIDLEEDSILICDLGPNDKTSGSSIEFTGQRRSLTSDRPMIV